MGSPQPAASRDALSTRSDLWTGSSLHSPDPATPLRNGHAPAPADAILHLRQGIALGRSWIDVLLEAVGLWTLPEERYRGRRYVYLIAQEALDWLLLAERLLSEVPGRVPETEKERLLFHGQLPEPVTQRQLQQALGNAKYQAHLNFFYGVVIEEALMLAVEEEILKERGVRGLHHRRGVDDLVMERLYWATPDTLLRRHHKEMGQRHTAELNLGGWKAFTYWLFKLRVNRSDQSRAASDTQKGLRMLQSMQGTKEHQGIPHEPTGSVSDGPSPSYPV
jgi:hypothetical protein